MLTQIRKRNDSKLGLESLERRILLTAANFDLIKYDPQIEVVPSFVQTMDFDSDGDSDVLVGLSGGQITWSKNVGGGELAPPEYIGGTHRLHGVARNIVRTDVDGDGDQDLLLETDAQKLFWSNNQDGAGDYAAFELMIFGKSAHSIDVNGDGNPHLITARYNRTVNAYQVYRTQDALHAPLASRSILVNDQANYLDLKMPDVDSDGDADLVVFAGDTLSIYTNDGGQFTSTQSVPTGALDTEERHDSSFLFTSDFDGDGDIDIVAQQPSTGLEISWYENDGDGTFGRKQVLLEQSNRLQFGSLRSVDDIDNDGDADLVLEESDKILVKHSFSSATWYENLNAKGILAEPQPIDVNMTRVTIAVDDMDQDGANEILIASAHSKELNSYRQLDDRSSFSMMNTLPLHAPRWTETADLDGDGDTDILSASMNAIYWYSNVNGEGIFETRQPLIRRLPVGRFLAIDFDADSDIDIATYRSDGEIRYYENSGGRFDAGIEVQGKLHLFGNNNDRILEAADFDGDGDVDLVTPDLSYLMNTGNGNFEKRQTLSVTYSEDDWSAFNRIWSSDFDHDGDLDIVVDRDTVNTASHISPNSVGELVWFENDGTGIFADEQVLVRTRLGALQLIRDLAIADFDSDGDADVMALKDPHREIVYYENKNLNLDEPQTISESLRPLRILAMDADNDGDADLVSEAGSNTRILQNQNGHFVDIGSVGFRGNPRLGFDDINGDGHLDLIAPGLWLKNSTPADLSDIGAADIDRLCTAIREKESNSKFDYNDDGQISHDDMDYVFEEVISTSIADVNLDGRFDSSDLVEMFKGGLYENDSQIATWSVGDFNCDGKFDTSDLVLAFQSGDYEV